MGVVQFFKVNNSRYREEAAEKRSMAYLLKKFGS